MVRPLGLLSAAAGAAVLASLNLPVAADLLEGIVVIAGSLVLVGVSADKLGFAMAGLVVVFIQWDGIRLAGGALVDGIMVLAFIAVLAAVVRERRPVPIPAWLAAAAAGLAFSALLTIMFPPSLKLLQSTIQLETQQSPVPMIFGFRSNVSALAKFEIAWVVLPLILVVTATTGERCIRLLDLWTAATVISALIGLVDVSGIAHVATRAIANHRSSGLTIHPNYLALESALATPFALLWCVRGGRWRLVGVTSSAILLGGVYASGSRAATVAAVLAVVLTVLLIPRLRVRVGLALPIVGMIVVGLLTWTGVGAQVIHQVRLNPGNATALASNLQRHLAAQVSLHQLSVRPVEGVGFAVIEDAHNIYLQLLAAGGLITMASFLVYCGGLASAARRVIAGRQRDVGIAASVSIFVWLIGGLFDNQLIDKFLYVVPGVLLAMSMVARQSHAHSREEEPQAHTRGEEPPLVDNTVVAPGRETAQNAAECG